MKKSKLLEKIKNISDDYFKSTASKIDKSKKFPSKVTKIFNKEEINQILGYKNKKKLDAYDEFKFYYYATKYCSNIRNYFLVSLGMVGSTILKFGSTNQKKKIMNIIYKGGICSLAITEPDAGSNINQISTTYIKSKNGYILNGKKKWITLGGISKLLLILAKGEQGLQLFIVDTKRKGIKKSEIRNILTNRASHIANFSFNNVKILKSELLGEKNNITQKALNFALINGRAIASASAFAMCTAALEEAIDYSKKRDQFGKKIWNYQLIQKIISDSRINISAGLAFSEKAFKYKKKNTIESENYCNMAKLFASQNVQKICSELLDIFGANGTSNTFNIERYFRESKGFQFIEGTSQILTQLIALNSITTSTN